MINNSEHQSLQKLSSFLQGLNKSIVKLGQSTNLNQISNNLDATASEIGFLLQGRDLNEYGQIVNKLSTVWKELYKLASTQKLINENENEPTDAQLKLELIQQAKRQMRDGAGEIGQLGGVRVSAYQSPQPKSSARQLSRQQTGLPSIQRQFTSDQKTKMNYEIDESQRELLQEVLRQSNKLNVQIVMKRYDPKITLLISEGTDTDLDVQEAMRGFNKDYLEIKLNDITHENEKNIQEIQKVILDKHDFSQIAESQASEKLKAIYKTIYTKTMEMDQIMIDAQKMEPQIVKNILDDFLGHVSGNYKEIQSETYKIVARMFQQIQQKQKQDELQKSKNLQVQPQHKKDKLSQSKRLQSSTDESQIQDKVKQELIEKKLEVDKKNSEISELQSKVRLTESQYIQTALELESMKLNVSKSEQDKAQLLYEFKKMEKSLSTISSKIFMDQGVQCTDIGQQHLIQKLQKENTIYEQKIYSLKNELSKASPSPRSGRELKPDEKSDDQMIQNSNNGTPKLTSRYRSAFDIDYQYNEDGLSIDQRLDSSHQNFKQGENRDDLGFERSPTHSNTYQGSKHKKSKLNNQLETRQTNSPVSGSDRSVKLQQQLSQASFNPKKKQKKSILKIEEEDSTLNQSADFQKQKIKKQSFSNKVTRRQTTLEVGSNHFIKQQKSVRDQDETQAGTNFETYRTESGQLQQSERIGGIRTTEQQGGRRIQTEAYELIKDSDDSESENNSKIKFSRSTTQKDSKSFILKKGAPQNQHKNSFARKSTDQPMIDVVEEIPSNLPSSQNLDKATHVKKQSTFPEGNNDQNSTIRKEHFKSHNASSPIRRSSTFTQQPQQLQMIIKLNDEDQQQYTTYWQQRHLEKETQTDFDLLLQFIQQTVEQLDIPQSVKQQLAETLPSKLEAAVNQIHQPGTALGLYKINGISRINETNNQDQTNRTSQSSRQSQESQKLGTSNNIRSTKSVGKQKLSSLLETNNQGQPSQTKSSLDQMSKIGHLTQKNSIEIRDSCNSDYGEVLMKSKGELESFQLDMQEKLLKLEDLGPPDEEDLGYEELVRQIVANENGGAALEEFKPKDIQSDNLVKKMYINLTNKKTTGSAAVQEMLKRYYKKSPREQVSYLEFKGFYQKVAAIHKQCGYNLACIHLQRFMMRLGFTCSLFQKRKILKTSLSILKPFNPLAESKQKLISQNSTSQAQTKNKMNYYFSEQ